MADKIKFLTGQLSDLGTAINRGQVYFAIDGDDKGKIVFDAPIDATTTKRIVMTENADNASHAYTADLAEMANSDSSGQQITSTYIKNLSYIDQATDAPKLQAVLGSGEVLAAVNVPVASKTNSGIVTMGEQSFAGKKIFSAVRVEDTLNYTGIKSESDDKDRKVWFSSEFSTGVPVYDANSFTYNPNTKTLKVTNVDGLASHATADENGTNIASTYLVAIIMNPTVSGVTATAYNGNGATYDTDFPVATVNLSGIVTAADQIFGGVKGFQNGISLMDNSISDVKDLYFTGSNSGQNGLHYPVGDQYRTIWADEDGVLYYSDLHDKDAAPTTNYEILHSGNATMTDNYLTSWEWVNGTTSGPTAIATLRDGQTIQVPALPSAGSTSGVLTTGNQRIVGNKTFASSIKIENPGNTGSNWVQGDIAGDWWRVGATGHGSYESSVELASAGQGNEPIYVRQYTDRFYTPARTLTLLDANGDTYIPGALYDKTGNELLSTKYVTDISGAQGDTTYLIGSINQIGTPGTSYVEVPIDLVGSSTTEDKIYLVGTKEQSAKALTGYSHLNHFIDEDNFLQSNALKVNYWSRAHVTSSNNYPYHRIVYSAPLTENNMDYTGHYYISQNYNTGGYGFFRVSVRRGYGASYSSVKLTWLVRENIPVNSITAAVGMSGAQLFVDIYYHSTETWNDATIQQIHQSRRYEPCQDVFFLSNSDEDANSTASARLTSTSFVSMEEGGQALRGITYSSYVNATEAGNVNHANNANSATYDSAGQTIVGAYIKALAINRSPSQPTLGITKGNGTVNTINFPIAGSENAGMITTETQYIAGTKIFGGNIVVRGGTTGDTTYGSNNPHLEFRNAAETQNISLIFDDFDTVAAPASLTLSGNQGGEYFIAPNIRAMGKFEGDLQGNADTATEAVRAYGDTNSIRETYVKNIIGSSNADTMTLSYLKGDGTVTDLIIPNASAAGAGLITASAQTFGGLKTFNDGIALNNKDISNVSNIYLENAEAGVNGLSYKVGDSWRTIWADEDGILYYSDAHEKGVLPTQNYEILHTGNATLLDNYLTSWEWEVGTSEGPTGVGTYSNGSTVAIPAIPRATTLNSGIVTNENQTFGGLKGFSSGITMGYSNIADVGTLYFVSPNGGKRGIQYQVTDGYRTIWADNDGTLYYSGLHGRTETPTENFEILHTGNIGNFDNVLTSWEWVNGTTAGATALATFADGRSVEIPELPAASETQSGIITTGTQSFAGAKTFKSRMTTKYCGFYKYDDWGIFLNNSDIVGVNSIYFGDVSETAEESINFALTDTTNGAWRSLWADGEGVLYWTGPHATGAAANENYEILHTGNIDSYDNYVTGFSWINQSWEGGPKATITLKDGSVINVDAIPKASNSISGIVTTNWQVFAGQKTFQSDVTLASAKIMENGAFALNMNNSDIINTHGIYFDNKSENANRGIHFYISEDETERYATLWSDENDTLYWTNGHAIGAVPTNNYEILHSGNIDSYDNYVTGFEWVTGTTSGPTGTIALKDGSQVEVAAIPAASTTQSGIVTAGQQTFSGLKGFNSGISMNWTSIIGAKSLSIIYNDNGSSRGLHYTVDNEDVRTLWVNGDGVLYLSNNHKSGTAPTENYEILHTGNFDTHDNYITGFDWVNGTGSVTATITLKDGSTIDVGQIPVASSAQAGVLNTGYQVISGPKAFTHPIALAPDITQDANNSYGINLNNSDMVNANSIYFADKCANSNEGIHFYISDTVSERYGSIFADENGVLYWTSGHAIGALPANNYEILHTGNFDTHDNYITDFSWGSNSWQGVFSPVITLKDGSTINVPAIPVASNTQGGIITTSTQTIAGQKNFNNPIQLASAHTLNGNGYAGLDMHNSDAINANSIYFNATSDSTKGLHFSVGEDGEYGSIFADEDGILYWTSAHAIGSSPTNNYEIIHSGNIHNYGGGSSLSGFAWNDGTSAGPTITLSFGDGTEMVTPAIPNASLTTSGIVTTGNQTFAGVKSFQNGINVMYNAVSDVRSLYFISSDNGSRGLHYYVTAGQYRTIWADSSGVLYYSGLHIGNTAPTTNYEIIHSGNINNYSNPLASIDWVNGTSEGPVLSFTMGDGTVVPTAAIPAAGGSQSGIVTTGNQAFSGLKGFGGGITMNWTDILETRSFYFIGETNGSRGLHYRGPDGIRTIWVNQEDGTLYYSGGHVGNAAPTENYEILHTGNIDTHDNYITSFDWNVGTVDGPTAKVTLKDGTELAVAAIPTASTEAAGIITTGAQTFGGTKTFMGGINAAWNNITDIQGLYMVSPNGGGLDGLHYLTGEQYRTLWTDADGILYYSEAHARGITPTTNYEVLHAGNLDSYDNYITGITWTNQSWQGGPIPVITMKDGSTISVPAIPSASGSQSGIVNTNWQTFAGHKIFQNEIVLAANKIQENNIYALDMFNSDIIRANGIYFWNKATNANRGLHFYISDTETERYATIWADENDVLYWTNGHAIGATPTNNYEILHSGNIHNYASGISSFYWNAGTTEGPTATIVSSDGASINVEAIPKASAIASGIVTTGEQEFSGNKTFNDSMYIKATDGYVGLTVAPDSNGDSSIVLESNYVLEPMSDTESSSTGTVVNWRIGNNNSIFYIGVPQYYPDYEPMSMAESAFNGVYPLLACLDGSWSINGAGPSNSDFNVPSLMSEGWISIIGNSHGIEFYNGSGWYADDDNYLKMYSSDGSHSLWLDNNLIFGGQNYIEWNDSKRIVASTSDLVEDDAFAFQKVIYTRTIDNNGGSGYNLFSIRNNGDIIVPEGELQFYDGLTRIRSLNYLTDETVLRIQDYSSAAIADYGAYGYSLVYTGTGTGNGKTLILKTDNQTSTTQLDAIKIYQDATMATGGRVGICGEPNSTYSLRVYGNTFLNGSVFIGYNTTFYFGASGDVNVRTLGIGNTSATNGLGISLYGGPNRTGAPERGLFYGGTATFGTLQNTTSGDYGVTGSHATYFTVADSSTSGWMFRRGSTNVAAITGNGTFLSSVVSRTYLDANKGHVIIDSAAAAGYNRLFRMKSTNGVFTGGMQHDKYTLNYTANDTIDSGDLTHSIVLLNEYGGTGLKKLYINNNGIYTPSPSDNLLYNLMVSGPSFFQGDVRFHYDLYWNNNTTEEVRISVKVPATSITQLDTELRISVPGENGTSNATINLVTGGSLYLNSKKAFQFNKDFFGINYDNTFALGIRTGASLIRTDNALQVGVSGGAFYANSSGNAFVSNSLGIRGTNTNYALYVAGSAYLSNNLTVNGWSTFNSDVDINADLFVTGSAEVQESLYVVDNITLEQGFVRVSMDSNRILAWGSGLVAENYPIYFTATDNSTTAQALYALDIGVVGHESHINLSTRHTYLLNKDTFYVSEYGVGTTLYINPNGNHENGVRVDSSLFVTGLVHTSGNDYAEDRQSECTEPGYVLMENGDDTLSKTTDRLQHFAGVSSDTYGFLQGKNDDTKTPIAVAGRVLVYTYKDRTEYKPGDCVCAAPGGTVDIMTRDEVLMNPDKIVGTVSCVPDYEEWGGNEESGKEPVKINGRIWIKVR